MNVRAGIALLLICGLAVHLRWWSRSATWTGASGAVTVITRCLIALLGFELITAETNDFFHHVTGYSSIRNSNGGPFIESVILAVEWIIYSLLPVWYGIKRQSLPVLAAGAAMTCSATGAAALAGIAWEPSGALAGLFLSGRPMAFAIVAVCIVVQVRWLGQSRLTYSWLGTSAIIAQSVVVVLGFEFIGTEVRDFFGTLGNAMTESGHIAQLSLAGLWGAYSLLPVWYGLHRRSRAVLMLGLSSAVVGTILAGAVALAWEPSRPIGFLGMSLVAGVFGALAGVLLVLLRWMRRADGQPVWVGSAVTGAQTFVLLLGFELIGVEVRDYFATAGSSISNAYDVEQLLLSVFWLLYAIVLIFVGIWRRTRWVRMGAMAMFGFSILKIFLYDLGFLPAGLRSISLAGLGIILLAVSFAYQRYRLLLM
ncbi:MAG: hypothetical protein NVS4B2_17240 [Chloroflexota bacterium]